VAARKPTPRRTRKTRARRSVPAGLGTAEKRRLRRVVANMVRLDRAIRSVSISGYGKAANKKRAKTLRRKRR
jgi:hypothetical protein